MNFGDIIWLLGKISIILVAFGYGMRTTRQDITLSLHHPTRLFRAFFVTNIAMLLFVVMLLQVFRFHPNIELILLILALSPVPPILPKRVNSLHRTKPYAYGLLTGAALLGVVAVPLLCALDGELFDFDMQVSGWTIVQASLSSVLLPVGAGVLVQRWTPQLAEHASTDVLMLGIVLLVVCVIFFFAAAWSHMIAWTGHGNFVSASIVLACLR